MARSRPARDAVAARLAAFVSNVCLQSIEQKWKVRPSD